MPALAPTPGYRESRSPTFLPPSRLSPAFSLATQTHLHGNIQRPFAGVCCTCGVSTQRMVLVRQEKPPRAGPGTLALALTGCLGLNEVAAGSGTWVPLSQVGRVFTFAESSCGDVGCCVSCLAPWHVVISCYCSDCDPSYRSTPKQSSAPLLARCFHCMATYSPGGAPSVGEEEGALISVYICRAAPSPKPTAEARRASEGVATHSPLPSLFFSDAPLFSQKEKK